MPPDLRQKISALRHTTAKGGISPEHAGAIMDQILDAVEESPSFDDIMRFQQVPDEDNMNQIIQSGHARPGTIYFTIDDE